MNAPAEASPRTDAEPMAFTQTEFLRGALSAWLWFLALSAILQVFPAGGWLPVVFLYTAPWSVLALLVGLPFAHLIGRAMRRVTAVGAHMLVFTVFGLAIGAAATFTALGVGWVSPTMSSDLGIFVVANIACAGGAVCIGWSRTALPALRADREGPPRRADPGPDEAFEDALSPSAAPRGTGSEASGSHWSPHPAPPEGACRAPVRRRSARSARR